MARKSRRKNVPILEEVKKNYRVGAYIRLSVANDRQAESIENQKGLILDYISTQTDMQLHDIYCDNGVSGTTFERPGFKLLMDDLKSGVINCVVVKDLSRFGRNYIEVGNYLERVFPLLDVRFVSVTEGFDTLQPERTGDSYIIPLKNLINQIYAKDISYKSGSVLTAKQKKGEFIGGRTSYGYIKDPHNKNHLIVDEKAASIVRKIFELYANGVKISQIIRNLEQDNISSPGQHHHAMGIVKSDKFKNSKWQDKTIRNMLVNQIYLGNMVQGRKRQSLFEGLPEREIPKDSWIIVPNTHDAIISQVLFDTVQNILYRNNARYMERRKILSVEGEAENVLKGLIFCAQCGAKLHRHRVVKVNRQNELRQAWYQYTCCYHTKYPERCPFTTIREVSVIKPIVDTLLNEAQLKSNQLQLNKKYIIKFEEFIKEKLLTREMALTLLERVEINKDKILFIKLRYCDEYKTTLDILKQEEWSSNG